MTKSKKNKRRRIKTKKNTKLRRGGWCKLFKKTVSFKTDSHNTITKKEPKPVSRFIHRDQLHKFMTKIEEFNKEHYPHHNEGSTSSSV